MTEQDPLSDKSAQKVLNKFRWIVLILILSALFTLFATFRLQINRAGDSSASAAVYASLSQLEIEQKKQGYVKIGRFGNRWPARLVETIEAEGTVSFVRKNGTPHSYRKFDGYRLRVLRLEASAGEEVILVLRSKSKIGVPSATESPSKSTSTAARPAVNEDDWEREMRLLREERAREEAE